MTHPSPPSRDNNLKQLDRLPSVGLLPGIFRKSPFYFLSQAAHDHGGFVRLKLGLTSVYLVSDPNLFQHILRDNVKNYRKSPFLYNTVKSMMLGEGLSTSEGDLWLRQRRMIQPQFHHHRLAFFAGMMTDAIQDVIRVWDRAGEDGDVVDLGERMARLSMEVVSRALFGTTTFTLETTAKIGQDMLSATSYVALRGYMPFIPKSIPLPGHARFKSAIASMTQAVDTIITAGEQNGGGDNLITMLLHAVDDETQKGMTHTQLFDEVITIFLAGFETTSTALTWVWSLLAHSPEAEQILRAEIGTVLGERVPTLEDIPKLIYCRQVLQESMRLYPPVPLLPRTSLAEDEFGGYRIPKGSIFLMFYYGLHHNPDFWDNPDAFDPLRFSPEQIESRHRFAYLPFSAGPRQCIGSEFAMMEGVFVLAMLLQRYKITVVEGQTISPSLSVTLKPSKNIKARMRRLSGI